MKWTVVRYRTKPEQADENQRLIEAVFRELTEKAPEGVNYTVMRLADGGFVHAAGVSEGAAPVTSLDAFKVFVSSGPDRWLEKPIALEATIVGAYGTPNTR